MLTAKYIRAHKIPISTNGFAWFFKLIYEFWGFCINGGQDLKEPGGFVSDALTGTSMPVGFASGSTVLLASGTDGVTHDGEPFFNTINKFAFSSSYVGKHLVVWKSGSSCTDDSVYEITQWFNSSSIRLNVFQGGTPYSGSLHPSLTERIHINYRVIDFAAAAALPGYTTNDYLVLYFNAAGDVNPGQALSQVKLRKRTTTNTNVGITMSPSGSWHGLVLDSGSWSSGSYSSGSYASGSYSSGSWSSGSYTSGSWSSGSWSSGSYSSGSWSSGSYTSGSFSSGSYASGSYSSGSFSSGSYSSSSVVHAPGDFAFFPTSVLDFTGSFSDIINFVNGTTSGSVITGSLSGTYAPGRFDILSGNFYYVTGGVSTPVISGTALFTGSFGGSEFSGSTFALTGTFAPSFAFFVQTALLFSGTYVQSASGVFTPEGTFTPSGVFTPSGTFNPEGTFTPSGDFIGSGIFTPTGTFTPTGSFIVTGTFTPSGDFIGSGIFTVTGTFTPSGSFIPGGVFTPTGTFTPTGNLLQPGFYDPCNEIFATTSGAGWGTLTVPAYISLWGAQDFLISHYRGSNQGEASGFHIEIPQRLYPPGQDPNPITCMNFGNYAPTLADGGNHYGGGFWMHNPPDNTTMGYYGMTRNFFGYDERGQSTAGYATNGRYNGAYFNTYQNKFLFTDIILARPDAPGQYQLARTRLRRVRAVPNIVPQYQRVGNLGEWMMILNGVMWPWDNALLPYNLFLGGN